MLIPLLVEADIMGSKCTQNFSFNCKELNFKELSAQVDTVLCHLENSISCL